MCGDTGLSKKWGNLLLVDAFALALPAIWVNVDQKFFGSAGCPHKQQQAYYKKYSICVYYLVCVLMQSPTDID